MHATLLAQQFELNHQVAHANLADITHEESLVHPSPAGNCLNWVLGHVVATRNVVMDTLGEPRIWNADLASPYQRGARPPLAATCATPLGDILAALDASQQTIVGRLATMTEKDLARSVNDQGTVGDWLARLSFHESYHLGQCGLLRRLLGKDGAIA